MEIYQYQIHTFLCIQGISSNCLGTQFLNSMFFNPSSIHLSPKNTFYQPQNKLFYYYVSIQKSWTFLPWKYHKESDNNEYLKKLFPITAMNLFHSDVNMFIHCFVEGRRERTFLLFSGEDKDENRSHSLFPRISFLIPLIKL